VCLAVAAIGKCMDAMMTSSDVGARAFLHKSFGDLLPAALLDTVPADAEPLAVLSAGLLGVRWREPRGGGIGRVCRTGLLPCG
jgi:hypothetical protein